MFRKLLELFNMKNIVVRPGDTLSKLILLEYGIDNTIDSALLNCLVKYIGYINGYNLTMLDNINSGDYTFDPDSLQPGKVLMFPNTLEEAFADKVFKFVSSGSCKQYYKPIEDTMLETLPVTPETKKMNLWPIYAGVGLLALLLIRKMTKKKKRK